MAITLLTRGRSSGIGIEPITSGFFYGLGNEPVEKASVETESKVIISLDREKGSFPFRSTEDLIRKTEDLLVLIMKGGYHLIEQDQKIRIQGALEGTIIDFSYPDWEKISEVLKRPEIIQVLDRSDLTVQERLDLIRPSLG